jgi:hypothetical protein
MKVLLGILLMFGSVLFAGSYVYVDPETTICNGDTNNFTNSHVTSNWFIQSPSIVWVNSVTGTFGGTDIGRDTIVQIGYDSVFYFPINVINCK